MIYLHVFYTSNPPFLSRQWFLKFQSSESEHIRKKIWDFLVTCLRKMSVKSECLHGLSKFKCVSLSTDQCRTLNLVEKNQSYCKKQKWAKIRFTDCNRYMNMWSWNLDSLKSWRWLKMCLRIIVNSINFYSNKINECSQINNCVCPKSVTLKLSYFLAARAAQ